MRKFFGIVLIVLGVPVLLAGAAAAVFVGPDNTVEVTNDQLDIKGAAVTTSPKMWTVAGPTLHVSATNRGEGEAFVGVAHPVHVDAYLDGVATTHITRLAFRSGVSSSNREGDETKAEAKPDGLDWWSQKSAGKGEQTVSYELSDEPASFVLMNADGAGPVKADLVFEGELDGAFIAALIVAVVGLAGIFGGIMLIRSARKRRNAKGAADSLVNDTATEDALSTARSEPLRRTAIVGTLGAGALLVGGCASIPETVDRSDDTYTLQAASTKQVDEFFATYTKVNNAANKTFDGEKIGAVESGTLLELTQFGYEEDKATNNKPIDAFDVKPTSAAVPELDSYPLWYIATDKWDGEEKGNTQYLVTREDPTSSWKAALAIAVDGKVELPEPITTDGAATVAKPEEKAVTALADKLDSYTETGKKPKDVDVKNAEGLKDIQNVGFQFPDDFPGKVSRNCRVGADIEEQWLKTEDGAMTMASLTCTQSTTANSGISFKSENMLGVIPAGEDMTETSVSATVSMIIELNDDGSATVIDEGADLSSTTYTTY